MADIWLRIFIVPTWWRHQRFTINRFAELHPESYQTSKMELFVKISWFNHYLFFQNLQLRCLTRLWAHLCFGPVIRGGRSFRDLVTAKVNIEEDQFLRECPEYLQLPRNRFSTSFPGHLVSMMCLMLTQMALGAAVNSF